MDKLFQFTSQPIQNSPWKMTLNLALTPLIIAVILFPYALFHEASSGIFSIFRSLFSALLSGFFVCLTYWMMVFPFLLVTHLLLRHYQLFNIITILISYVLGILIMAYLSHPPSEAFSSHFLFLLCFSLPMALFYSFLSWQADQT